MKKILRIYSAAADGVKPEAGLAQRVIAPALSKRLLASRLFLSLALTAMLMLTLPQRAPQHQQEATVDASVLAPDYLSDHDRELYRSLFDMDKNADPALVDATLAQLDN